MATLTEKENMRNFDPYTPTTTTDEVVSVTDHSQRVTLGTYARAFMVYGEYVLEIYVNNGGSRGTKLTPGTDYSLDANAADSYYSGLFTPKRAIYSGILFAANGSYLVSYAWVGSYEMAEWANNLLLRIKTIELDTIPAEISRATGVEEALENHIVNHENTTTSGVHGSTVAATADKIVHRDSAGRAQIVDPSANADIDTKGARDAAILIETNRALGAEADLSARIGSGGGGSGNIYVDRMFKIGAYYTNNDYRCYSAVLLGTSIYFGCEDGGVLKYDGSTWTKYSYTTTGNPSTIYSAVLFGTSIYFGCYDGGVLKYDGTTWTKYSTTTTGNSSRCYSAVLLGTSIYFGCYDGGVLKYDGTTWTKCAPATTGNTSQCYSAVLLGTSIYFGCADGGVLKYDGTTWTEYSATITGNTEPCLSAVLFGTSIYFGCYDGGVLKYDGTTWTKYSYTTTGNPSTIYSAVLLGTSIYFGCADGGVLKYDGTTWTKYSATITGNTEPCLSAVLFGTSIYFGCNDNGVLKCENISALDAERIIYDVTVTGAAVTLTPSIMLAETIRIIGTRTANCNVICPTDKTTNKIIDAGTGAYYILVKTTSGTGVYSSSNDVADIYCDGTNIVLLKMASRAYTSIIATGTPTTSWVQLAFGSPTGDALSEISGNAITVKNSGRMLITFAGGDNSSVGGTLSVSVYKNGSSYMQIARDTTAPGNAYVGAVGSLNLPVMAGEVYTIWAQSTLGTMNITGTLIYQRA